MKRLFTPILAGATLRDRVRACAGGIIGIALTSLLGWLLLKGLSLREISIIRETQEKTVRQQASSIYKKSGVNGRHAFSAWFIEDIL